MGSPVAQLLLESVLAPFVLVGLVLMSIRLTGHGWFAAYLEAFAVVVALGTTFVLAFGWPADLALSARSKITLAAVGGCVVGLALCGRVRWARIALIAGVIGMPLWIGFPALEQGRPESALILLPVATAFAVPFLVDLSKIEGATPDACPKIMIAFAMALGLGMIAVFARTFSYAELALSLASALLAALTIGQRRLAPPALITVAATLLALITALLLYSDASLIALLVLSSVIGAERLGLVARGESALEPSMKHIAIFCALPTVAAIVIARIDAGPFSTY